MNALSSQPSQEPQKRAIQLLTSFIQQIRFYPSMPSKEPNASWVLSEQESPF